MLRYVVPPIDSVKQQIFVEFESLHYTETIYCKTLEV